MTTHAQALLPKGGKAHRVYLLLCDDIANGRYAEGEFLPGENRLASILSVSRITVRRALDALAADGWIEKRVGAGSVVLPQHRQETKIAANFATLIPQLVEFDQKTTARLLSFSYNLPSKSVAAALGLTKGQRIQTAVRVRLFDGEPFSFLTTHVPEEIARNYDETDLATQPLFRLLERNGVEVEGADQTVTATLAGPGAAESLDVAVGSPLLSIERVVRDASGRGVEHLFALYRPDRFRIEMSMTRTGAGKSRQWQPVIGAQDP
ncbi:MAG: GntR family transcriptional regulator [Aestuariivita sp.]|nr:GntR family transcriptional regulator [Aestuariivita sp.]MCY4346659.1 GntR family transcriptional regulator [Aestuariivita sp.]